MQIFQCERNQFLDTYHIVFYSDFVQENQTEHIVGENSETNVFNQGWNENG